MSSLKSVENDKSVRAHRKKTGAVAYRFGFNGKEKDNDVKGGEGTQQDYGMRVYDPRLGRFLSVDPLTKQYPNLTPYSFAENDVISSIDLDGLEKYRIVGRSFAPQGSFSGTHFESKADDRTKFEIADFRKVSARIHVEVGVNLDAWELSKKIYSQPTITKDGKKWPILLQEINAEKTGEQKDKQMNVKGDYSAKNGTLIGPGIDIQFDFNIHRVSKNELHITSTITGNVFPAQETMIFDSFKNGIFLGTSTAMGGPLTGVWGDGKENILVSKQLIRVQTDDDGNFLGILAGKDKSGKEQVVYIPEWNSTFTSREVWIKDPPKEK